MPDDRNHDSPSPAAEIDRLRADIDALDEQILALINRRLSLAGRIGSLKQQGGHRILDSSREADIIRRLAEFNRGPLSAAGLRHIFMEIITLCRDVQKSRQTALPEPERGDG